MKNTFFWNIIFVFIFMHLGFITNTTVLGHYYPDCIPQQEFVKIKNVINKTEKEIG